MAVSKKMTPKVQYCIGHDRVLPISEFWDSTNQFHPNGKFTYCKECVKEMFNKYLTKTGSLEASMYFTLATIGYPFVRKLYETFEKQLKDKRENGITKTDSTTYNYVGQYLGMRTMFKIDSLNWNDFSDTDVEIGEIKKLRKSEEILAREMDDLKLVWGKNRSIDQIEYLEYRWDVYTTDKDLTDYQESQYRNLCLCELEIFEGDNIDKASIRQRQIAKVLGIDTFQIDKEKTDIEKILESQIAVLEKEEPAEYYKDLKMYYDFMGIKKSWDDHVIRPLRNLLLNEKEYHIEKEVPKIKEN